MTVNVEVHLLVAGVQSGPHTAQEVVDRHRAGLLPDSALYWSPGMADWSPILQLVQPPPAPGVSGSRPAPPPVPTAAATAAQVLPLGYDAAARQFTGTLTELLRLAVRAVQARGWTVTDADDTVGLLTFETKMSWGSWSGITATLSFTEAAPYRWHVGGTGKQNVRGDQLVAFDFGESDTKVRQAIETMIELVPATR